MPIKAAKSATSVLAWIMLAAELLEVLEVELPVEVAVEEALPAAEPEAEGVPNKVTPLGRGPGFAEAEAPWPTRAPTPWPELLLPLALF